MPRFIVCAAIPLFDRGPINPPVPINRLRAARSGGPGVLRPALPRALGPAAASPTASLGLRNGTSIAAGVNDDGPRDARNRVRARR
jgi:hypothetical protein